MMCTNTVEANEVPGLGFEPRQTEPESVVLPLHYPGVSHVTYFRVDGTVKSTPDRGLETVTPKFIETNSRSHHAGSSRQTWSTVIHFVTVSPARAVEIPEILCYAQ